MKLGYKTLSHFQRKLESNFVSVSVELQQHLKSNQEENEEVITLLFAYLVNITKSQLYSINSSPNDAMDLDLPKSRCHDTLLTEYLRINREYTTEAIPIAVVSQNRIIELFGRKGFDALKYLDTHGFIKRVDLERGKGKEFATTAYQDAKGCLISNQKNLKTVDIPLYDSDTAKRFRTVLSYDHRREIYKDEAFGLILESLFKAQLPLKIVNQYKKSPLSFIKKYYGNNNVEQNTKLFKRFLEWQETPNWDKPKFISRCIGGRTNSPISQLPESLRKELVIGKRNDKGIIEHKTLVSIDIEASLPTTAENKIIRFLKGKIPDKGRNYPSTIEKAIEKDLLLRSYRDDINVYESLADELLMTKKEAKDLLISFLNGKSVNSEVSKLFPMVIKYKNSLRRDVEEMEDNYNEWNEYYRGQGNSSLAKEDKPQKPNSPLKYIPYGQFTKKAGEKPKKAKPNKRLWTQVLLKKGRYQNEDNDHRYLGYNSSLLDSTNLMYETLVGEESDIMGIIVATLKSEYNIDAVLIYDEIRVENEKAGIAKYVIEQVYMEHSKIKVRVNMSKQKEKKKEEKPKLRLVPSTKEFDPMILVKTVIFAFEDEYSQEKLSVV
jgi:hypothetical protein